VAGVGHNASAPNYSAYSTIVRRGPANTTDNLNRSNTDWDSKLVSVKKYPRDGTKPRLLVWLLGATLLDYHS